MHESHGSVEQALASVAEFRLAEALQRLAAANSSHFLCDEAFYSWAATAAPAGMDAMPLDRWTPQPAASSPTRPQPSARNLLVCSLHDETKWLERIRGQLRQHSHGGQQTVQGVFRDILPQLVAGSHDDSLDFATALRSEAGADIEEPPEHRYAILSTPRSGSYFLSGLLRNAGFGMPREHLRSSILQLVRNGHLKLLPFLEDLEKTGTLGGAFGTKWISHYLFEVFDSGVTPTELFSWLQRRRFKLIHLERGDRIAQAVSFYLAEETGIWNRSGPQPSAAAKPADPPYDFERIRRAHDFLNQQQAWLDELCTHVPNVLHVRYEELDQDNDGVLDRVLRHIDGPTLIRPPKARTERQRNAHSEECAARFRDDLGRLS
ncbi:MAG: Stf0 family sulfotransferase [Planctomycetota bacterium]